MDDKVQTVNGIYSGYGSCVTRIAIWTASSKKELISAIKKASWQCSGDNPGRLYAQSYQALRYYKTDDGWAVVVDCSSHYDV